MAKELWAATESKNMTLKDKRRNERVTMMLEMLADNPAASITQAHKGENDQIKAAYRFIGTSDFDEQDILEGHYQATIQRVKKIDEAVIIVCDGMDATFSNLKKSTGLGTLGNSTKSLGIKVQNTFVFSEKGIPLGLINQAYWMRPQADFGKKKDRHIKAITEKESYYWIKAIEQIESRLPKNKNYSFVGDGAADIYDLFAMERRTNSNLLIHLVQNRKIENEEENLFELLEKAPLLGTITKKLNRTATRPERTVELAIRSREIVIMPPKHRKKEKLPTIKLNAIYAQEIASDLPSNNTIVWRLMTTINTQSLEDAVKHIDLYAQRWLIERFHYIYKEGCHIEKLQLETADNLKRAMSLYSITAWRTMYITYIARIEPDAPCTRFLSEDEWRALWCYHEKKTEPPVNSPTCVQAVNMIAKLGGFMGRKNDGDPGAKVIWRGLASLEHITATYCIFKKEKCG